MEIKLYVMWSNTLEKSNNGIVYDDIWKVINYSIYYSNIINKDYE